MKNRIYVMLLTLIAAAGCRPAPNYSNGVDHTLGMTTARTWSGYATGYYKGDTTINDVTEDWPKYFYRTITDSTFGGYKVNGFTIQFGTSVVNYRASDSVTSRNVVFDSVIAGSLSDSVICYYVPDSVVIHYTYVTGYNSAAGQYYVTSYYLHTTP